MSADQENRTYSDKFMLRLPDGMRERIKVKAEKNGRSMNAEIVSALEGYFPKPKGEKEVVEEVIELLSYVEPELREKAITLLGKQVQSGDLSSWAQAYAYAERDRSNRFPWEDE